MLNVRCHQEVWNVLPKLLGHLLAGHVGHTLHSQSDEVRLCGLQVIPDGLHYQLEELIALPYQHRDE